MGPDKRRMGNQAPLRLSALSQLRGYPAASRIRFGHLLRMRHQREVAGVELDRGRVHALGEEALEVGIDGLVVLRHRVPGRLRVPRSLRGAAGEDRGGGRPLHGVELPGLLRLHAIGKIFQEGVFGELCVAVVLLTMPARTGPAGNCFDSATKSSFGIGRACGDVDEAGDLRVGPDWLITVPPQECATSTVGPSCSASARLVASTEFASDDSGFCTAVTFRPGSLQDRDHLGPARAVGPGAVHQHDVPGLHGLRGLRVSEADGGQPAGSRRRKGRARKS